MDIKEAKEQLLKHKKEIDAKYISARYSKAIEVLLNELDKDNNIISDLQNEVTLKQCELDNKDKIINEMANFIEKDDIAIEDFICPYCKYQLDKECTEKECIEQIIDYFTKKAEGK